MVLSVLEHKSIPRLKEGVAQPQQNKTKQSSFDSQITVQVRIVGTCVYKCTLANVYK